MRGLRHISVLFLCISLSGWAQTQTIGLSNSSRFRMQPINSGEGSLIASEHRFGFDSSWVELSRLDPQGTAEALAAYRFGDPLWFMFDGTYGAGGMVVSGTLTSSYVPHLVRFAYDGSITWTKSFTGMQFSQTRFAVLLTNGFHDFAYTNADSFGGSGMYRVQFDAGTGENLSVVQVTTDPTLYFRAYCGANADAPLAQVLGGSGVISGGDFQALLGRFDETGATWLKLYQLESVESQSEEVVGVANVPSGGYACAMNATATSTTTNGIFMLTDDDGQPISGTRLSDPSGVYLTAVLRLYSGDFLVAGSTNSGLAMLFKLSSDGALIWARRCDDCFYAPINSFHRGILGELHGLGPAQDYEIATNGDACGFEPVTSVTAAPFLPMVTDIAAVNDTGPAVTVGTLSLLPRTSANSASVLCNTTSVPETLELGTLVAYPDPMENTLMLDGGTGISPQERVVLLDMHGSVAFDGPYNGGIDVSALASGVYACLLPRTLQRVQVVKR